MPAKRPTAKSKGKSKGNSKGTTTPPPPPNRPVATPARKGAAAHEVATPPQGASGNPAPQKRLRGKVPDIDAKNREIAELKKAFWGAHTMTLGHYRFTQSKMVPRVWWLTKNLLLLGPSHNVPHILVIPRFQKVLFNSPLNPLVRGSIYGHISGNFSSYPHTFLPNNHFGRQVPRCRPSWKLSCTAPTAMTALKVILEVPARTLPVMASRPKRRWPSFGGYVKRSLRASARFQKTFT